MRTFHILPGSVTEADALPSALPALGFVWFACSRSEFEQERGRIQATLQVLTGVLLSEQHICDLLNNQLPSHFDCTSQYDMLVFRRLAAGHSAPDSVQPQTPPGPVLKRSGPPALRRIDTSPVGFAVFDRVLLTLHPTGCAVLEQHANRLLSSATVAARTAGVQLPTQPAELMLRIVHQIVDGYLDLRRDLTRQLDHWQVELLNPKTRFNNWSALLDARSSLNHLDEICEDQRAAVLDWMHALSSWSGSDQGSDNFGDAHGLERLKARSRDVLEHIERVAHHVRRLEQNAASAVQMHFSAQSNRTNDIMRTLTAITAVFMPLNLIAGIFGMNFEFMPLLSRPSGFWLTLATMTLTLTVVLVLFWRKRYLVRTGR